MADEANKVTKSSQAAAGAVRVRRARVASDSMLGGGVVVLGADDFAQIEECTTNQSGPNSAMLEASAQYLRLMRR